MSFNNPNFSDAKDAASRAGSLLSKGLGGLGLGKITQSSKTPDESASSNSTSTDKPSTADAADIPKEDLLHLSMKLSAKLKAANEKYAKLKQAYMIKKQDSELLVKLLNTLGRDSPRLHDLGTHLVKTATDGEIDLYVDALKQHIQKQVLVDMTHKGHGKVETSRQAAQGPEGVASSNGNRGGVASTNGKHAASSTNDKHAASSTNDSQAEDDNHNSQVAGDSSDGAPNADACTTVSGAEQSGGVAANHGGDGGQVVSTEMPQNAHVTEIQCLKQAVADLTDSLTNQEAARLELSQLAEQWRVKYEDTFGELTNSLNELEAVKDQNEEHKATILNVQEKVVFLKMQLEKARKETQTREDQAAALVSEEEHAQLRAESSHRESQVKQLEAELQQVKVKASNLTIQLQEQAASSTQSQDELVELRVTNQELGGFVESLKDEVQAVKKRELHAAKLLEKMTTELAQANERLLETTDRADAASRRADDLKEKLQNVQAGKAEQADQQLKELEGELASKTARLGELEEERARVSDEHQRELDGIVGAHAKQLAQLKEEERKKSKSVRQIVDKQSAELEQLRKRNLELETESETGKPSERKLFEFAKEQSQREKEMRTYEKRIAKLNENIAQLEDELQASKLEEEHLHNAIVKIESEHRRDGVNMEYLKNIIVRYMTFDVASSERRSLTTVIATILEFSDTEKRQTMPPPSWWDTWTSTGEQVPPSAGRRVVAAKEPTES